MAQEIRVINWCDPCLATEEHTEGRAFVLEFSIDGSKPVRLEADLCETHGKEVLGVTEWLTQVGRRSRGTVQAAPQTAPAPALVGSIPCPECGQVVTNRTGMIQHLTRSHHLELERARTLADQAVQAA